MNKNYQENNDSNFSNKNSDESGDIELKDHTEIDIFSSKYGYDDSFVEKMLKPETKWNEKKQAFDDLAQSIDPEKIKYIKNTDRSYFIEMVKKLLKQPNINVVHSIINALNNLALGLTNNFFEAKDLFPYLLYYLKEKKESIINSLINCLSNFSLYMTDNIITEKLMNYCSGKNLCNLAKINLCSLIEKIIDKKSNNIQLNIYFNLLMKIGKYLEDQNPEVRERSSKLMAFINFTKKDLFNSLANSIKLDNKKRNKIAEYEKLYINLSYNKKINVYESSNNKNQNKENINNINNNIVPKKTGKKLIDYNNTIPSYNRDNNGNIIENKEEIIYYAKTHITNLDNSLFNSLKWEERKEGFSILNRFINEEQNLEEINKNYDYYFKYILISNKFFGEKNFMVINESIHCIINLIEKVDDLTNKYYKIIISSIVNKLNEKKIVPEIQNLLHILMDKTTKSDVIITFINSIENKQSSIIKEGNEIIKNIINDSNELDNLTWKEIINFCIKQLNSTANNNNNNIIKKSFIQLLCCIYQKIGNDLYLHLKDLNQGILSIVKVKFAKVKNGDSKFDENLDEVVDDIDISNKITEKMIKDLKEGKWFDKKNVIEQLEGIMSQYNHNITSSGLNELFYIIKSCLIDGNKNIVKLSIKLVSTFLDALSPGLNSKSFVNIIISNLISNFSENKNSIKDLSVNCVNKIIDLIGIDSIINDFAIQLKTENSEIKNEILKIINKNQDKMINQKENKDLIYSLINCLLDKNNNIRNNAKVIIQDMMKFISPNLITDYINKMKPSYTKQINDMIFDRSSNNVSKAKSNNSSKSQNQKLIQNIKTTKDVIPLSKQNEIVSNNNIKTPLKIINPELNKYSTGKKSVSKSPILSTKSSLGDYKFNIVDVLPPEKNELPNYIQMLNEEDIPTKIMALTEIKKIIIHFVEKNEIDIGQINDILIEFNNLVYSIMLKIKSEKDSIDKNDNTLIRYLLDDYIYIVNRKSLINSITDENLIYNCYEKLFLLISLKELKQINNSSEIISILNTIILCSLSNFDKTLTIISLINLLSSYKSNQDYPLVSSLAIKCLDKFRKILSKIQNQINNSDIFISLYNFFIDFSQSNKNLETNNISEQNSLLMINEFIKEFINIYGDNIWNIYHNSLDNNMLIMDVYLKRTIEILYKEKNSENIDNDIMKNQLGISQNDNDETIKEIMDYVNEIKNKENNMNEFQNITNSYFEIIRLLRTNNLDIALLKDKIDQDILDKIFELYYSIKENDESKESIQISQPQIEEKKIKIKISKNNINKKPVKEISEQSKRIMDYKNKLKYLTESDGFRNKKTSIKANDENKQMENKNFAENNMRVLDEITFQNNEKGKNNNNISDEIINMKKKLEEIRKKIK